MTAKYLTGIDVSQYQGTINWQKVRDAKIDFVYMRSNVGTKQDTHMKRYCRKAGLPFGLYVYIKPEEDVVAQMQMMLDNHKKTGATLIPQIDIEHHGGKKPKELKKIVRTCIKMTIDELGKPPSIYTYPSFWNHHITIRRGVKQCPLWVARYVYYSADEFKQHPVPKDVSQWSEYAFQPQKNPATVKGWGTWDVWQFAANHNQAGKKFGMTSAHLDLNIMKQESMARFTL